MTKRLIPYAGAEQRDPTRADRMRRRRQRLQLERNGMAAPAGDPLIDLLVGEILRVNAEIQQLQDEADTINRILSKIRADRGAIT
jgi:hypothetical protein